MPLLNRFLVPKENDQKKILQFGCTPKLLASLDLIVQTANEQGNRIGIVLVENLEKGKGEKLYRQDGRYTVNFLGEKPEEDAPKNKIVTCINNFLDYKNNLPEFLLKSNEKSYKYVFSDMGKENIVYKENEDLNNPVSYPAVLCAFLKNRYEYFKGNKAYGLIFIPLEDLEQNGEYLQNFIIRVARDNNESEEFINWIKEANTFLNCKTDIEAYYLDKEEINELNKIRGYRDNAAVKAPYVFLFEPSDIIEDLTK